MLRCWAMPVSLKEALMHDLTTPNASTSITSIQLQPIGVRGWLLVLCLMLTAIGPAISAWLKAHEYAAFSPYFPDSVGLQATILSSLALTTFAVVFGTYAGILLWFVRPGAVKVAKSALLLGLAVDIVTTAIYAAVGQVPVAHGGLVRSVMVHMIPSLIFFTVCFAYLNKSDRVNATYLPHEADA